MRKHVVIIGGGPGGYAAFEQCVKNDLKVTLIEKSKIGGTCLNCGCIPTKTLKHVAETIETINTSNVIGLDISNIKINMEQVIARKDNVINILSSGLLKGIERHNINYIHGHARIISNNTIRVTKDDNQIEEISCDAIIIATGSNERSLPNLNFDHKYILSSNDLLSNINIPSKLVILGAGVIGCELACIYRAFGSEVVLLEVKNDILPIKGIDKDVVQIVKREMKKRKISIETLRSVKSVEIKDDKLSILTGIFPDFNDEKIIEANNLLISVGRSPNSNDLFDIDLANDNGWINVDKYMKTSVDNIYAIGDALGPKHIMLAHVAEHEAIVAVKNILNEKVEMNYKAVPSAIFTSPECACVGLTEDEAKENQINVKSTIFQIRELGKAHAMNDIAGICKIVADANDDKILGVHMVGAHSTDIISEATLALNKGLKVIDLVETIHPHPTLCEGIYKAACLYS